MANIGSFKKSGGEFQGEIVTLSVQTKNVRIVPETNRANDNAPSHRVYVGRAEIGAAWSKRSTEGRDYLSVMCGRPRGCKRKIEKSDRRFDCDHVSGLLTRRTCPLAQMGSAIQPQTSRRPRRPLTETGSLDRRFDRLSSHSALTPWHR